MFIKHRSGGFDGFLIGNLFDPGLREAREIADIPVISLGETVFQWAGMMGESIGIVTINRNFEPRLNDVLARMRIQEKISATSSMAVPSMAELETAESDGAATQALLKRFAAAAEETVAAGAEVVVAGGGVVMAIVADQGMYATTSDAPIVNGVAALVQQGESAVRLQSLMGGNFTSGRLTYAKPTRAMISGFRKAYGQRVYPGVKEE